MGQATVAVTIQLGDCDLLIQYDVDITKVITAVACVLVRDESGFAVCCKGKVS